MSQNPILPGALIEQVDTSILKYISNCTEKLQLFLGLPLSPEFSVNKPKIYKPEFAR